MKHNNDNKFDLDLKDGVAAENCLAELLLSSNGGRVEVKSEFSHWKRTGNIAIEYMCNGKDSGISVTQAEWWAINFFNDDKILEFSIVLPVDKLKGLCDSWFNDRSIRKISGGDRNASRMMLVPIHRLMEGLVDA